MINFMLNIFKFLQEKHHQNLHLNKLVLKQRTKNAVWLAKE